MSFKGCMQRSCRGVRGRDFRPGWCCGQHRLWTVSAVDSTGCGQYRPGLPTVMALTSACLCSPPGWADRMFWTLLCPGRPRGRTGSSYCLRSSPVSTVLGPEKELCLFSRWALRGPRRCTGTRYILSQTRPSCPGNGPVTPQHARSRGLHANY